WIDFFMSIKDKVNVEDLIVHEPFWTLKREERNVQYVMSFLIYIVLIARIMYGCVLITGNIIN
nr:hypothetical protein [Thermoproteota archaeon]